MALVDFALELAKAGIPIFPCWGDKTPATDDGFKSATTNLSFITDVFQIPGVEMIGSPTGLKSGLVILDIDKKEDENGLTGWDWYLLNKSKLPDTRIVRTASGGLHYYFCHPGAQFSVNNDTSVLAHGVDIRGDGGYAIIPPSPGYEVVNESDLATLPDWLLQRIVKQDQPDRPAAPIQLGATTPYGRTALKAECAEIAATGPGSQEQTLSRTSYSIGRLVSGGHIDQFEAETALIDAGLQMASAPGRDRWTHSSVSKKVQNGLQAGMRNPRGPEPTVFTPQPSVSPVVATTAPSSTVMAVPKFAIKKATSESLKNIGPRRWLYGRELIIGYPSMLGAPGGTGKSALALLVALSVASGKSLLATNPKKPNDHEKVYQRGGVLYLNTEDPSEETERRLFGILRSYGLNLERDEIDFKHASALEVPFKAAIRINGALKPSPDLEEFIEMLKANKTKLLVVDPFVHSHEANENDNTEIGIVMSVYKMIAQKADCAVWLIHHTRKGNAQAGPGDVDTFRGAAAIKDGGRVMSTLKGMTAEEAENLGVMPVERRKSFVRLDNAKQNMSASLNDVTWYRLDSESLNNGTPEYPDGDSVQVIRRWSPPLPTLNKREMTTILNGIGSAFTEEPYSRNSRSNQWAGHLFVEKGLSQAQASSILRQLIDLKILQVETAKSKASRKTIAKALSYDPTRAKLIDMVKCDLIDDDEHDEEDDQD